MLPQFELQKKRRMHAKRRRQEQRQKVALIVFSITCLLGVLIFFNIFYIFRNTPESSNDGGRLQTEAQMKGARNVRRRFGPWVSKDSQPFNQDQSASRSQHLIIVAGHSVTVSGDLQDADHDEKDWFLLEYQKGKGLPEVIIAHIKRGIEEADKDPDSLLVFSGGETRASTGPFTEAASYFNVADAMKLWPDNPSSTVRARTAAEEYATDSFQNLLFSICRFHEVTGSFPAKITVISFSFKGQRFEKMHARALSWPPDEFVFIGVDPPASTGFDLEEATRGEQKSAVKPFESDPYGCHSAILQEKRKARNPLKRTPPYELSCPELRGLLNWCGPTFYPKTELPWGKGK